MKNAVVILSLGLVAMALSGCGSNGTPAVATTSATPAGFSSDAGGIEGFVTDDENIPLPGVQLGLLETDYLTLTDAEGRFSFSLVPPGDYNLAATRLGYSPATVRVTVMAGAVTDAELRLVPLAVAEPYVEIKHHVGAIGTGIAFVRSATCTGCASNETSFWHFGGFPQDYVAIMAEATWDNDDYLGFDLVSRGEDKTWYRTRGESPMRMYAERCGSYIDPPMNGRNPMPCTEEEIDAVDGYGDEMATLETWYLGKFLEESSNLNTVCGTAIPGVLPGYKAGCYGLGVAQDLTWQTYLSVFHMELPNDVATYTALPDA